jgi:hypothetical protein
VPPFSSSSVLLCQPPCVSLLKFDVLHNFVGQNFVQPTHDFLFPHAQLVSPRPGFDADEECAFQDPRRLCYTSYSLPNRLVPKHKDILLTEFLLDAKGFNEFIERVPKRFNLC